MRKITKIELPAHSFPPKKKVAAYARVSMETESLHHSLSAQVSYYSELIQSNPAWEYAGVYADEGISGTGTSKRNEFQQMLTDCEGGKIDIILAKSISRFARNTVDLLETVRHLKDLGIEVYFEKENINSMSDDGELMLTLLASFAQEESRSISENMKWSIRKRFEQGIPATRPKMLGYRWKDNTLVVVPEEAKIVKRIFQNFLDGKFRLETARELDAEGFRSIHDRKFGDGSIKRILTNITYTGNLLFQKEYIKDPITKKHCRNKGELPQYWVENTHEALIDLETFQFIQEEMRRRREHGCFANKALHTTIFTQKLKCCCCNRNYVRSQRFRGNGENRYSYVKWVCSSKKKHGNHCRAKDIPELQLYRICSEVLGISEFDNKVFADRISRIDVIGKDSMLFHFTDGTEHLQHWESTARKDCWDDAARQRMSERVKHIQLCANSSCFTSRIKCESCGVNYRRATRVYQDGTKYYVWADRTIHTCKNVSIYEDTLQELTAQALGISSFDDAAFTKHVNHIGIIGIGRLRFYFRDGTIKEATWSTKRRIRGETNACTLVSVSTGNTPLDAKT